ncbi:PREDICTED: uncharacterized protein LOC104767503 [Camelina sativa]|uniref:Uncharacterized protein LOC104767503 n=1 Tax=Camelina sativa TaxID=90675 RepID=A0ABM0XRG9_CAMSA|nr:PREDICTED: uncharacterized protein LOC104767503 [Camelina sativa]
MFVWTEPWIEDNGMRAPWRKNTIFDVCLRVKDLIDPSTGLWDLDALEEHFFPQDINRIQSIKPVRDHKDYHVWKHNKSGEYSVKSGYWLASLSINSQALKDVEAQPSLNGLKAEVWSIQTAPKIKIFLWKVLSGALPVANLLRRRGIEGDELCRVCGEAEETINHILFTCTYARQIWALSDYPSPNSGFQNGSVFSNVYHLLTNRNNLRWPADTKSKIHEEVDDWFQAQIKDSGENLETLSPSLNKTTTEDGELLVKDSGENPETLSPSLNQTTTEDGELLVSWSRPQESWVKCNVGCSWSKGKLIAGGAWIVRNDEGIVLMHSRRAFSNTRDKDEGVFRVLEWAMESMLSHRFINVIFAIQDKTLVGAVNRPKAWPSFRFQSMELRRILGRISGWCLEHELEQANRGAGLIAQSITRDLRMQSYVAVSYPQWLSLVFEEETSLSFVI